MALPSRVWMAAPAISGRPALAIPSSPTRPALNARNPRMPKWVGTPAIAALPPERVSRISIEDLMSYRATITVWALALLGLVGSVGPGESQTRRPPKSPAGHGEDATRLSELARAVVQSMTDYRAALARSLVAYEENLRVVIEAVAERRSLYRAGALAAEYVEASERELREWQRSIDEVKQEIDEADRIIVEASIHEQLARRSPLPAGGFEDTATLVRYNGPARWSLGVVPKLEGVFAASFGRSLPISSRGQTAVHDRLGLDHRNAIDVALHPDSSEGRWLMNYLRQAGIPFIGVRSAIPGSATGAHIHVGPESPRMLAR